NLQRIRELTVQAYNGTNSSDDLNSINAEIKQRLDEIQRVADQTQFNGIKVLNGSSTSGISIQVGANDNETISISGTDARVNTLLSGTTAISSGGLNVVTSGGVPTVTGGATAEIGASLKDVDKMRSDPGTPQT